MPVCDTESGDEKFGDITAAVPPFFQRDFNTKQCLITSFSVSSVY